MMRSRAQTEMRSAGNRRGTRSHSGMLERVRYADSAVDWNKWDPDPSKRAQITLSNQPANPIVSAIYGHVWSRTHNKVVTLEISKSEGIKVKDTLSEAPLMEMDWRRCALFRVSENNSVFVVDYDADCDGKPTSHEFVTEGKSLKVLGVCTSMVDRLAQELRRGARRSGKSRKSSRRNTPMQTPQVQGGVALLQQQQQPPQRRQARAGTAF